MISEVLSDFPSQFALYFLSEQNKGNLKSKSTCTCTLSHWSEFPWLKLFPGSVLNVQHGYHRAGNGQGKNISSRSGERQGISLQVRGNFMNMNHHIGHEIEQQTDGGFSKKSILFARYC